MSRKQTVVANGDAENTELNMKLVDKWYQDAPLVEKPPFVSQEIQGSDSPTDACGETSLGQDRKVLVVDDNPVVLKAFELKLKALGFQVLTATEAAPAISCALEQKPDLIVLDFNFPPDPQCIGAPWNGFTIMKWVQRLQEATNIPVIIISSTSPAKLKDQALAAGAVAFFQKPVDHKEFIEAIRKALAVSR